MDLEHILCQIKSHGGDFAHLPLLPCLDVPSAKEIIALTEQGPSTPSILDADPPPQRIRIARRITYLECGISFSTLMIGVVFERAHAA
jgi:hypothetical protein